MMMRPFLVLGLVALLGVGPGSAGEEPVKVAKVHAFFANLPEFDPPVEDLKLFRFAPPAGTSPSLNAAMNRSRMAFQAGASTPHESRAVSK